MFIRAKNYDNAIQSVRIEVGTLVGLEKDDEAYIVLKEMPTMELMNLRKAYTEGDGAVIEFFKNAIPNIIKDHNFYETEQAKMSNEAVRDLIFEKIELSTKVMNEYSNANFFTQEKKNEKR